MNTGTTPKVNYMYANGSANHVRRTKIEYPNGRFLHVGYNSGDDSNLSRPSFLADDSSGSPGTHLAEYTYLALSTIVKVDYTEPDLRCDLAHGSGSDPYDGLDRFDRVIDLLWRDYGASIDAERVKHGYDRASNRKYRECPVPAAQSPAVHMDELYGVDGIYQLKDFDRGDLNGTKDGIVSGTLKFAQEWALDATGNWSTFKEDATGDGTFELDQSRTHNKFNEITQIASSSSHVAHDKNGNMTKVPKPADWNAHYDLKYDAWNRMVEVKDGANKVLENVYDALNRRVQKKPYTGGVLDYVRHLYHSDQWQVLEERKDSATRADRQFVWGLRYIDDLILRDRDADGSSSTGNLGITGSGLEERLYCLQDPNWNVTAVANTSGDIQERYAYIAYGKPLFLDATYGSLSSSSYDWETLFAGYRWDKERESYGVRYRDLICPIGRWGHRDPAESAWQVNAYAYVTNSPVTFVDAYGLFEIDPATAAKLALRAPAAAPAAAAAAPAAAPVIVGAEIAVVVAEEQYILYELVTQAGCHALFAVCLRKAARVAQRCAIQETAYQARWRPDEPVDTQRCHDVHLRTFQAKCYAMYTACLASWIRITPIPVMLCVSCESARSKKKGTCFCFHSEDDRQQWKNFYKYGSCDTHAECWAKCEQKNREGHTYKVGVCAMPTR